jgi:hypothetical protein
MKKVQRPRAIYGEGVCECAWVVGGLVVGISQKFHFNKRNYRGCFFSLGLFFRLKNNKK